MALFSSIRTCFSLENSKAKEPESGKHRSFAKKRIKNELKRATNSPPTHISFGLTGDDWFKLQGAIMGPSDTPFEGGVFFLSIEIPADYPIRPPKIKFKTKVFYPNISEDGTVYIDILGERWSAALTIEKMLISICSFLPEANPEDPFNPASILYRSDKKCYEQKAREWTFKYAS